MKLFPLVLLLPFLSVAQQKSDSKIIVTVGDTSNLYNNVKYALVKNNFIVKDDGNKTILTTYAAELSGIPGYSMVRAELNGSTVTLSGVYGLIKINDWGYTRTPNNYKRIIYYKGSKTWKKLMSVANAIENKKEVSYAN